MEEGVTSQGHPLEAGKWIQCKEIVLLEPPGGMQSC